MKQFDVQAIEIAAPADEVFAYVRDPANLTVWTEAFDEVKGDHATLRTPKGSVDIELEIVAHGGARTIDWVMRFPDGAVALAQSRVTETTRGSSIYSFVLHAPPVPLEALEGALAQQRETLAGELLRLAGILAA
jgi:hypothetical protein